MSMSNKKKLQLKQQSPPTFKEMLKLNPNLQKGLILMALFGIMGTITILILFL